MSFMSVWILYLEPYLLRPTVAPQPSDLLVLIKAVIKDLGTVFMISVTCALGVLQKITQNCTKKGQTIKMSKPEI